MLKVHSLENWRKTIGGAPFAVTFGNFDGVHIGHQKMLKDFIAYSKSVGATPVVFTFSPHPEVYFHPERKHLITSEGDKLSALSEVGVENLVLIDFKKIQCLTGLEFARKYIFAEAAIRLFWVGYDFTLGKDHADPLKCFSAELGEDGELKASSPFVADGVTVSSSEIRKSLSKPDLERVTRFLGRPFKVSGIVGHGKKLGRQIGFPTINLDVSYPAYVPAFGVYRVECVVAGQRFDGVMNVGVNPSVGSDISIKWEVHLLGFEGDLYHKEVSVHFMEFVRGEKKFASLDELKTQIAKDIIQVKESLRSPSK